MAQTPVKITGPFEMLEKGRGRRSHESETYWKVVVRIGSIIEHKRFDSKEQADAFVAALEAKTK